MGAGDVEVNLTQNDSHKGAKLDGTDDTMISPATSFEYGTSRDFSIAFWFKCDMDLAAAANRLMSKTKISTGKGWFMDISQNKIRFYTKVGSDYNITADNAYIYLNKWTHIAITIDRDVGGVLYLNGSAIATTETNIANLATDNLSSGIGLQIGQLDTQVVNWLNGTIADLQIFSDKVLSATEVSNIYNNIAVTDGLESAYDFLDGTYNDRVGSNNLTNNGTYITIPDVGIATVVAADRTTANDHYLIYEQPHGQVGTVIIEEAP